MRFSTILLLALLVTASLLAACSGGGGGRTDRASVRVLQASPDAPTVDLYVDGKLRVSDLEYRDSKDYLRIAKGSRGFVVTEQETGNTLLQFTRVLEKDSKYTFLAVNNAANMQPLFLTDDTQHPSPGNILLRMVHASPSAPILDVYLTAPDVDIEDVDPSLPNLPFFGYTPYYEAVSGDYRITLTPVGTKVVAYDSGIVSMTPNSILTVVAIEDVTTVSDLSLIALTNIASLPSFEIPDTRGRLRAVHLSPEAPNMDVLLDDTEFATDLIYQASSGYHPVRSGAINVKFNEAGTTTTLVETSPFLALLTDYTLFAANVPDEIEPWYLQDDNTKPDTDKTRIRIAHGSPGIGVVDVYVTIPNVDIQLKTPTLTDVQFKDVADYLEIDKGIWQIRVTEAGTKTVLVNSGGVEFQNGWVRTVVVIDKPSTSSFGLLILQDRN